MAQQNVTFMKNVTQWASRLKVRITKLFSNKLDLYLTFSKFKEEFKDKQLPFTYLSQWCRERWLLRVELGFKDDLVEPKLGGNFRLNWEP